ncbi:glycosyltransferase [Paenibacillus tyrfis]|uniref:glycosyltransferase n=1 Tax=Paenibacillus tyrfis TaxID=1501230 RepID=UPI002165E566|nr:glycosyltransferase [Paenibacillus tyrfis]
MELKKALISSNLLSNHKYESLIINLKISDGMRNEAAFSSRYFVTTPEGEPICTIKKIKTDGLFDVNYLVGTQNQYRDFTTFSTPKIFNIYNGIDGYTYILEEYIDGCIPLNEAVDLGLINKEKYLKILKKVLNDISQQPSQSPDQEILNREINDIINAVTLLNISDSEQTQIIAHLRKLFEENLDLLADKLVLTTRDLIARNILINPENSKVYITDFDLSRKTHFFWLDIYRCCHYSNVLLDEIDINNEIDINKSMFDLLFHLNELTLQFQILNHAAFLDALPLRKQEINIMLRNLFGISIIHEDESTDEISNIFDGDKEFLQVFWKENDLFSEKNSQKLNIVSENEFHNYQIKIPSNFSEIRIDPSDNCSYIVIKSIHIYSNNIPLIHINKGSNYKELILGHGIFVIEDNEAFTAICLQDDPQLFINLPRIIDEDMEIGEITLSIEMKYCPDISEPLLKHFNKKDAQINLYKNEFTDQKNKNLLLEDKIEVLVNEIDEYKTITSDYEQKNHELSELVSSLYSEHQIQIQNTAAEKQALENELSTLKGTLSWRITRPLRSLGRIKFALKWIKRMAAIFLNKKYVVELIPGNDLVQTSERWSSIGSDPYFIINRKFLTGWVKIRWTSCSPENLPLKLYWDEGNGMDEKNSLVFGVIKKGELLTQEKFIFISPNSKILRLDPGESKVEFCLQSISMFQVSRYHIMWHSAKHYIKQRGFSIRTINLLLGKVWTIFRTQGLKGIWHKVKFGLNQKVVKSNEIDYLTWLQANELTEELKSNIIEDINNLHYKPLISILIPIYNVDEEWLVKCIDSVRNQLYDNWELCIADDASTKSHVRKVLESYVNIDERIKVIFRHENGHISEASNSALELVKGEFIALLDHDDELTVDALYENVRLLNRYPDADMIYSDEDKISVNGERHSPFFKPDWSPDTFLSQMYTCHLGVYRTSLIREIGGFRRGYEGSQDYDLVLRLTEHTDNIYHIPKVLYHWRSIPQSTASGVSAKDYTKDAGYKALVDAVKRRGFNARVEALNVPNLYLIHHEPVGSPKVSILIPTRNMSQLLDQCLISIFEKTTYSNFEVVIIDNESNEQEIFQIFDKWKKNEPNRFKVLRQNIPFNYSRLNNEAIKVAEGELILLLNNDIEVITPTWLEEMVGQAVRSNIGAVGANLLYPDDTTQHAGIILGIGGVAGHSHKYFNADDFGYFSRLRMVTNYSAVTAACLMLRKKVYEEVGGLDELLTVAFNDVDFCLRIREKGYYIVWLPQVKLYHHESKSRGQEDTLEKQERFRKEIEFMQKRWGDKLTSDPFYNVNLTLDFEDFRIKSN